MAAKHVKRFKRHSSICYKAIKLRHDYAAGVAIENIWEEINADIDLIFPVSVNLDLPKYCFPSNLTTGHVQRIVIYRQPKFISHANRDLQQFTRQALEAILVECEQDLHMTAQRHNRSYRKFYARIRRATEIKRTGVLIKRAYEARQKGRMSVKHFIALNTAADIQRERLLSEPLSASAYKLIEEIVTASEKKLRYLAWAMYGDNQPYHPIHTLDSQEQTRIWEVMTAAKARFCFHDSIRNCSRLGDGSCHSPVLSSWLCSKSSSKCRGCARL